MKTPGRWRLAVMMALLYAVQGSFWPLLAVHLADLGIQGQARGWIFATLAIGSLTVPLGAGQLVDRFLPTQWFLALTYTLGTGLLVFMAMGLAASAGSIFLLFLVYWSLIGSSYSLSNSLAMRNLDEPTRRVWLGTTLGSGSGWMIAGWVVSGVMASVRDQRPNGPRCL